VAPIASTADVGQTADHGILQWGDRGHAALPSPLVPLGDGSERHPGRPRKHPGPPPPRTHLDAIFGAQEPQPPVRCLNPNRIVAAADPAAPGGQRWIYPASHHIRTASRNALRQLEPDDDTYKEACDRLEYLASLIAMAGENATTHFPWAGEFIFRNNYLNQDPKLGDLLAGGAFGGDPERAKAAHDELATWIAQHGQRW
jgi:hypothetical protein